MAQLWISIIRFLSYLLYHPLAWSYDQVAAIFSAGHWNEWLIEVIPFLQGSSVLELGHGPGHLLEHLADKGFAVIGVDESRAMSAQARRRFNGKEFPAAPRPPLLVRAETQSLPFSTASFPYVVCTFPAEYILDPRTSLEVRRVLAPNGVWVTLASAWLTSSSLSAKISAFLLRSLGQRDPHDPQTFLFGENFRKFGFSIEEKWIGTPSGIVLVILARPN